MKTKLIIPLVAFALGMNAQASTSYTGGSMVNAKGVRMFEPMVYFLKYAPPLQYPYEARSRCITGSGVFMLKINPQTGYVTSVATVRSTGSPILDNAALSAFRPWIFKDGWKEAVIPVTFTLTSYDCGQNKRKEKPK